MVNYRIFSKTMLFYLLKYDDLLHLGVNIAYFHSCIIPFDLLSWSNKDSKIHFNMCN